jgi:hypothetical protein
MFGPSGHDEPFPMEAAYDLRALVRLLYLMTPASDVLRRVRLAKMGENINIAIELAGRPQKVGLMAAHNRADSVCRELAEVIGDTSGAELVTAAVKRMARKAG